MAVRIAYTLHSDAEGANDTDRLELTPVQGGFLLDIFGNLMQADPAEGTIGLTLTRDNLEELAGICNILLSRDDPQRAVHDGDLITVYGPRSPEADR